MSAPSEKMQGELTAASGGDRVRDEAELVRQVNLHKDTLWRLAYGYLRNRADAEDVVQNAFLKLYRSGESFADDECVKRWLVRVTINECTSLYRALRRRPENIDDYVATLAAPDEHRAELIREVMALPARYRDVVYLFYYEGYSTREITRMLGAPEATVRTRLARGRRRLRTVLEDERGETAGEGEVR